MRTVMMEQRTYMQMCGCCFMGMSYMRNNAGYLCKPEKTGS